MSYPMQNQDYSYEEMPELLPLQENDQQHPSASGGGQPSTEKKKRAQKCSFCMNHGILQDKKGHKKDCSFKECECDRCYITKSRQETMRNQQKLTRLLKKIETQ